MKRAIWIIIGLLIIIFLIVKPIRTVNTMEGIASEELENVLFEQFGKAHYEAVLKQLEGPKIVENEEENYVEFKWYTKLANSDTAYIYIDVFKSPFSESFFSPRVTMNNQWEDVTPY